MSYVVYLKRSAEKELSRLNSTVHGRVVKRLLSLEENPRPPGVRKLRGRDEYRLRVGHHRILYIINESEKKIEIVAVGHRKEVYR